MRDLNKTIAVLSLLVPCKVYPLGIGEIKLHSALNQSLDAEIALIMSRGESISDIQVRLAPPEKFDEAGVPWSYFLSKIKFEAVTRNDGSSVVKLSSNEILREPFLDFLVEVSWAQGNIYREFTVLVDPPAAYKQPVVPIIQKPKQVAKTEVMSRPVSTPVAEEIVYESSFFQYGPTNRSDSLWKVAKKTNSYADVSIEQMMMAIYKANPNAFYKENVNALMADKVLEIPEKELVLKLSRRQALAAFKKQNEAWNGQAAANKQADANKKAKQIVAETLAENKQLELEAPVDSVINESVVVVSDNNLSNQAATDTKRDQGVLVSSEEALSLQARMEKLEQQLLLMQKMLVLKDEQIAALQNQKKTDNVEQPNQAKPAGTEIKEVLKPEQVKTTELKADKKPDIKPVEPVEKTQTKVVSKPKVKPKAKVEPAPESDFLSDYLPVSITAFGMAILALFGWLYWSKRKEEERTETESLFASASEISMPGSESAGDSSIGLVDDTSYDVGTVGESSFLSEFTPSDFDAFDTEQDEIDPISEADVYLAYGRYQQAEDLIRQAVSDHPERDECKLKLLEIFYANENKDAFQEYAEELVSAGKHKDHEFWTKVIDMGSELIPDNAIFTEEAGGKASFETEELVENVESVFTDNVLNEPVETIVNEEVEDASLKDEDVSGIDAVKSAEESANELDFDLSVFDANAGEPIEEEETNIEDKNQDIDFDLSVFDLDEKDKAKETKADENEVESIDFDLNSVGLDEPAINAEQQKESSEASNDTEFDLSMFDSETQQSNEDLAGATDNAGEGGSIDGIESIELELPLDDVNLNDDSIGKIDLSDETLTDESLDEFDFSVDSEPNKIEDTEKVEQKETPENDESFEDFVFEFDTPVTSSDSVSVQESDVSDLTDMDELETKMDLAKAYIDMGDSGSAKKIAEEVLDKGSDKQKKVAQEIIDQLS